MRVYLLHHAGGSRSAFRGWDRRFPPSWEVGMVEDSRRGAGESAPRRLDDLADLLLDRMAWADDVPYAVFGHSMGALLGFALTLRAASTGRTPPIWLGVSAHPGPRTSELPGVHLHRLSAGRLRQAVAGLGGIPAEVVADDLTWAWVEPLIRSDLVMVESWQPPPGPLVAPVPISAYCGRDDAVAAPATVARWAHHTERFLGVRVFPGGHFYFRQAADSVVGAIVADLIAVQSRYAGFQHVGHGGEHFHDQRGA
jgi:surfactin synthase thioesterase subunit